MATTNEQRELLRGISQSPNGIDSGIKFITVSGSKEEPGTISESQLDAKIIAVVGNPPTMIEVTILDAAGEESGQVVPLTNPYIGSTNYIVSPAAYGSMGGILINVEKTSDSTITFWTSVVPALGTGKAVFTITYLP